MKCGTLQLTLHSKVAGRTKLHVVKSTDLHCILNKNINKCRREKTTKRTKCQILPSATYSSYHAGVSPEGWTGKQSVFLRIQVPTREVGNKAENRERDWEEMLKIRTVRFAYVIFVRITRSSQPRAIPIG